TRQIRIHEADHQMPACPIIALTANAMDRDREACLASGMTAFLSKPVRRNDLMDSLSEVSADLPPSKISPD
ncbi:MAG: response regulator, partial [Pseudomonadota bacterium]